MQRTRPGRTLISRGAIDRAPLRRAVALAIAIAASACVHPDYHCTTDVDCDVGQAGRCEADHRCTAYDHDCTTHRRYSDHSGPSSNTCFDDSAAPANPCAAGQPPAPPTTQDPCAAAVCQVLPTCCKTGWSEACVQQAQILCSATCDTRIAITANKPMENQFWDVRWDGTAWTASEDTRQNVLAWLAPAPGSVAPRLAGFTAGALVVDGTPIQVDPTGKLAYLEATSVDFDRDGRPTATLGYTSTGVVHLQIVKLDDGSSRIISPLATTRLSWGDVDHDAFPDAIAAQSSTTRYFLLPNTEADDLSRQLDSLESTTVSGGTSSVTTGDPPPLRSFDWIDINGDQLLDVVAYGYSVNLHTAQPDGIGTVLLSHYDCDPPAVPGNAAGTCDATAQADQAFAGAALSAPDGPALVLASHPKRALYRLAQRGTPPVLTVTPYVFPDEPCTTAAAGCPPILAVVIRDLDGDHKLDVIAVDADLDIYTALGSDPSQKLKAAFKVPTAPSAGFFAVRTSVSGAPR